MSKLLMKLYKEYIMDYYDIISDLKAKQIILDSNRLHLDFKIKQLNDEINDIIQDRDNITDAIKLLETLTVDL